MSNETNNNNETTAARAATDTMKWEERQYLLARDLYIAKYALTAEMCYLAARRFCNEYRQLLEQQEQP